MKLRLVVLYYATGILYHLLAALLCVQLYRAFRGLFI